jgi:hypothetical protein
LYAFVCGLFDYDFVFAVFCYFNSYADLDLDYLVPGAILGTVVGMIAHELGHMFACLTYGGNAFELGVGIHLLLPVAYVMMDESRVKDRLKKAQVYAAGVEMNMQVASVFILCSNFSEEYGSVFVIAAITNVLMALLNMVIVPGIDGGKVFFCLIGIDETSENMKLVVKYKSCRKRVLRQGFSGLTSVVVCYVLRTVQVVGLPLVIVMNIIGVILCFV